MLESVERTSSLMAKLELDEQVQQAEKVLNEIILAYGNQIKNGWRPRFVFIYLYPFLQVPNQRNDCNIAHISM